MRDEFKIMNEYGNKRIPFLFIISYDKSEVFICKLEDLGKNNVRFLLNNRSEQIPKEFAFTLNPIDYSDYLRSFNKVKIHLEHGDTYILNLTFQTEINTNLNLEEIFIYSQAPFKLLFQNQFVCFSPEQFIKIIGNKISTNPMKGTIESNIPNAEQILMNSKKEIDEHYTIVDLLRNDLSLVASQVRVEKFRYIDKVPTNRGEIIQTSSLISGILPEDWNKIIGDLLNKITPAGSVTGAPKIRTCELIDNIENYKRGFYTGIAGIYDGVNLESYVLIRYIENQNGKLYFKSGGGITTQSIAEVEFKELMSKIYVPIVRNN